MALTILLRSTASPVARWKQLPHNLPLPVCQIAGILLSAFHVIAPSSLSAYREGCNCFSLIRQFQNTFSEACVILLAVLHVGIRRSASELKDELPMQAQTNEYGDMPQLMRADDARYRRRPI